MEFGLALILLIAILAIVVLGPLRRPGEVERRDAARRAELEAAKEAQYREIRDAGLSGAFGVGSGAGPLGGGSLVERNLNRWTIVFALLFVGNVIALLKVS